MTLTRNLNFIQLSFLISLLLLVYELPAESVTGSSKHFVLVHGACHGAWSWFKLVPLLRSSGHNVTTVELAASGIDPLQINDLLSVADYIRPLTEFMSSLPPAEKVILVGHSLGGWAISQTMETYPNKISVAVFLTALMPGPSINISTIMQEYFSRNDTQLDNRFTFDDGSSNQPTTITFGPVYLSLRMYQLSSIQDWTLATTLMRQTRIRYQDSSRELKLTEEKYGSVKRVFIISEKDLTIKKDFQQWMIEKSPPHEAQEILGSDHVVMISKPKELWVRLLAIAKKYD